MLGFDSQFHNITDYILGITHEIWEQRQVDTLNRYYAQDLPVRSPSGVVVGNQAVIAATLATQAEFPDRTLLGEDVIWSGDEQSGFLSSHRIFSTATHGAAGLYGAASGIQLRYRVIADCAVASNQIYDEWLVRDQGAIVRQLGLDPKRFAATQIETEGGPAQALRPFTPAHDVVGRYKGVGNDHPAGLRYESLLRTLMAIDSAAPTANAAGPASSLGSYAPAQSSELKASNAYINKSVHQPIQFPGVDGIYDRAVNLCHPGGRYSAGISDAVQFWTSLRAAFPQAHFEIHHRIGRSDPDVGDRAAIRWSLTGTHDGEPLPGTGRETSMFGKATGAPVHVMGISHADFGPRGLRREFVLLDETAIWKQILLHTG